MWYFVDSTCMPGLGPGKCLIAISRCHVRPCALTVLCGTKHDIRRSKYIYIYIYITYNNIYIYTSIHMICIYSQTASSGPYVWNDALEQNANHWSTTQLLHKLQIRQPATQATSQPETSSQQAICQRHQPASRPAAASQPASKRRPANPTAQAPTAGDHKNLRSST